MSLRLRRFFHQSAILMAALILVAGMALCGLKDILNNVEHNKCEMTYMFQWPIYVKVPLFKGMSKDFPRYSLYFYGEGSQAEVELDLHHVSGIPVLFIPGNAGSHKQVRSLASVALRKAENTAYEFNYFTADLDERLSGLSGVMLGEQTEFIRLCIKRILRLYKGVPKRPKSIVLIGHSMGGVIAKALFTLDMFDAKQVHTIVTLGTPHQHPVVPLDPILSNFYNHINWFWHMKGYGSNSSLTNISMVSIGGGFRDLLVRSSVTSLHGHLPHSQGISVISTSIPRVWASVDHLCLCWCKQLVLVINRALFDMVDTKTTQIVDNKQIRQRILEHHFVQNPGTKDVYMNSLEGKGISDLKGLNHIAVDRRLWVLKGSNKQSNKLYTFVLDQWKITHNAFLVLTDLQSDKWLFACKESSAHPCSSATDLSHYAQLLPTKDFPLKYAYLRLSDFPDISHFAVAFSSSKSKHLLMTEFHSIGMSSYIVDVPWLFSGNPTRLEIEGDVFFSNISLSSIAKVWKVYDIQVTSKGCEKDLFMVGRVNIPWFNENVYVHSTEGSLDLQIKLHHPRPRGFMGNIEVHLWLDPKCSHSVTIKPNLNEMLGQVYRFFGVQLSVWVYSMILLVLAWQVSSLATAQNCLSIFDLAASTSKSFRVLLLLTQVHFVISQVILPLFVMQGNMGQHDWLPSISDLRTFDWLLPLVVIVFTAVLIVVIIFVWNGILLTIGGRVIFWQQDLEELITTRTMFPVKEITFACLNTLISLAINGVLGLLIAFMFFIGRSCKQSALLRQLKTLPVDSKTIKVVSIVKGIYSFSLTISTLSLYTILLNSPSLVVWAKALPYQYQLAPDPTCLLGALMGLNLIHLGYHPLGEAPQSLVYITFFVGVIVTQAPIFPLYMVSYTGSLVLTALNIWRISKEFKERQKQKKAE